MCLPTGDTPSPVYAELARLSAAGTISFAQATIVGLDEWIGLPEGDPARCDVRMRSELIDLLDPAPAYVPIRLDLPPDDAAVVHDQVVAQGIDLCLLGLGMNGHVGFNEPGSTADSPTRVVELAPASRDAARARYGASATPVSGITVGLSRVLEAREVWLLVTGHRKADILRRMTEGPETPEVPASWLRRHPALRIIADEAAAATLPASPGLGNTR